MKMTFNVVPDAKDAHVINARVQLNDWGEPEWAPH